jgi:putative transposase
MSKPDRVVVPGLPHHITHRGNRREEIFRETDDYQTYLRLLRKAIERHGVLLWSYSLMPNHVHLVAVPERQESLGKAMHWAHGNYAGYFMPVMARLGIYGRAAFVPLSWTSTICLMVSVMWSVTPSVHG